jgi:hypothetical protein
MSQTRDEIIRHRLTKMTEWAKRRRDYIADHRNELKEDWYIRIGGNGYRAVSLDLEHPLLGFASSSTNNIETAITHFQRKLRNKPRRCTPERRAQAWLIKQAINGKLSLKTYLGLDGRLYEELLFALDEVSFGDKYHLPILRFDILAVGICDSGNFPVFIELKSDRELGQLHTQLRMYQDQVKPYEPEFKELLKACVDREVNLSKYGRIIVWPKSTGGRVPPRVESECDRHKVTIIESDTHDWSDLTDFSFHPYKRVYPPTPYIGES